MISSRNSSQISLPCKQGKLNKGREKVGRVGGLAEFYSSARGVEEF